MDRSNTAPNSTLKGTSGQSFEAWLKAIRPILLKEHSLVAQELLQGKRPDFKLQAINPHSESARKFAQEANRDTKRDGHKFELASRSCYGYLVSTLSEESIGLMKAHDLDKYELAETLTCPFKLLKLLRRSHKLKGKTLHSKQFETFNALKELRQQPDQTSTQFNVVFESHCVACRDAKTELPDQLTLLTYLSGIDANRYKDFKDLLSTASIAEAQDQLARQELVERIAGTRNEIPSLNRTQTDDSQDRRGNRRKRKAPTTNSGGSDTTGGYTGDDINGRCGYCTKLANDGEISIRAEQIRHKGPECKAWRKRQRRESTTPEEKPAETKEKTTHIRFVASVTEIEEGTQGEVEWEELGTIDNNTHVNHLASLPTALPPTIVDPGSQDHVWNKSMKPFLTKIYKLSTPHKFNTVLGAGEANSAALHCDFGLGLYVEDDTLNLVASGKLENQGDFRNSMPLEHKGRRHVLTRLLDGRSWTFTLRGKGEPLQNLYYLTAVNDVTRVAKFGVNNTSTNEEVMHRHRGIGHAGTYKMNLGLKEGYYASWPFTKEDVTRARIEDTCDGCIQGKMDQRHGGHDAPRTERTYETGEKLDTDTLFCPGTTKRPTPYFLGVDEGTDYIQLKHLPNETAEEIAKAATNFTKLFERRGYKTTMISGDAGRNLMKAKNALNSQGIRVTQTGAAVHAKLAESHVSRIRKALKASFFSLPFKMCRRHWPYLINFTINALNATMTPKGMPNRWILKRKEDGDYHRYGFGQYGVVLQRERKEHTEKPNGDFCIYLGGAEESGAAWYFLLESGEDVFRYDFSPREITNSAIARLNQWSEKEEAVSPCDVLRTEAEMRPVPDNFTLTVQPILDDATNIPIADFDKELPPATPANAPTSSRPRRNAPKVDYAKLHNSGQLLPFNNWEPNAHANEETSDSGRDQNQHTGGIEWEQAELECGPTRINTVQELPKERFVEAEKAEMQMMLDFGVIQPVAIETAEELRRNGTQFVRTMMRHVDKYDAAGNYLKSKARFVARGDQEKIAPELETLAQTAHIESILVLANTLVSNPRLEMAVLDVKGAFLRADMPREAYILIQDNALALLLEKRPKWSEFVSRGDSMVCKLLKGLYGLADMPKVWKAHFDATMLEWGFKRSINDVSLHYIPATKDNPIEAGACHVDDMFHIGTKEQTDGIIAKYRNKYGDGCTIQRGNKLSCLGFEMEMREEGVLFISQPAFTQNLMDALELDENDTENTPYTADLFQLDPESPVFEDTTWFRSKLMSLAHLAKTRPELKVGISALAVRQSNPRLDDVNKLMRMAHYVNGTKKAGLTISKSDLIIRASADAAFANHLDAKSHSGVVIWMGKANAPIHVSSKKQSLVTRSSTEAEMVALTSCAETVIWLRNLVEELGFPQGPTSIQQDNQSVITMQAAGPGATTKGKYIAIKFYFTHELIEKRKVVLEYVVSEELIADALSKGQLGLKFLTNAQRLRNSKPNGEKLELPW